jgi:GGDEF domain-containing protein
MESPMNDQRILLAGAFGLVAVASGVFGWAADVPFLGAVGGIAGLAAAILAARCAAERAAARRDVDGSRDQMHELEGALAEQVRARMVAEDAVRSLGQELAAAQAAATRPTVLPAGGSRAITDPVTGLFSEDYFRVAIDARIAAARRHLRPVAVVLLEVIEGLRTATPQSAQPVLVSRSISEALRDADTACRLLDGRFALVLEDTAENGAIWAVERIRRSIAEVQPGLTLRAGIACYPAHAFATSDLLGRATEALVAARDWNQDRIEVASSES